MSNYFKFSNIDTTLGKRIFNSLFYTYGGNIDVTKTYGNSYEERLFDLEGFNFRRLQSLKNCGGPAVIKILSYYLLNITYKLYIFLHNIFRWKYETDQIYF